MSYVARSRGPTGRRFALGRPSRRLVPYSAQRRARFQAAVGRMRVPRAVNMRAAVRAASLGVGQEKKTFDINATAPTALWADTSTAVATSANGYLAQGAAAPASAIVINQIPQNTSAVTRIGRKALMKALHIRGRHYCQSGGSSAAMTALYLVYIPVLDRTVTTMPPHNVITGAQDPETQTVVDNAQRFKILRKWQFNMIGDLDAASTGQEQHLIDEMVPINREVCWNKEDTTGVFDNMERGALCLYAQGTGASGATTSAIFQLTTRLYFADL